jgi:hypothetical protein
LESALNTEAIDDKVQAENYRAQAISMRSMATIASNERLKADCLELTDKWDLLAERQEHLLP